MDFFFECRDTFEDCFNLPDRAHSFPRASLSENCSLLGTDYVRGQISEHIFAPNEGYCLYIHCILYVVLHEFNQLSFYLLLALMRTF